MIMDTLLFTDQPNIEIYVDLAIRDVLSVQNQMMNDFDSPGLATREARSQNF